MTPLQWAVLTAYASSLPGGHFRRQVQEVADTHAPTPARQGAAHILSDACGMTRAGKITKLGRLAALKLVRGYGVEVDKIELLRAIRSEGKS